MNVSATVSSILSKYVLKGEGVLLGVSGGVDSMVLLTILAELRSELGFSLAVAHLNHRLRGQASIDDQKLVESYCRVLGVPLALKTVDVQAYADDRKMNLEEAGRDVRYEFFKECIVPYNVSYIVTAHHKNDFAETVLGNLIRGAGLAGLSGFAEKQGNILRPLIAVAKDELVAFAKGNNVPFNEDASNDDMRFRRNVIRHSVMPLLQELNSEIAAGLVRQGKILGEIDEFLLIHAQSWINSEKTDGGFSRDAFFGLHPALRKTVVRLLYRNEHGHERNFTFDTVERACDLILRGETGKRVPLGDAHDIALSYDRFFVVESETDDLSSEELGELEIDVSGSSAVIPFGDFSIRCDVLSKPEKVQEDAQYLDLDKIPEHRLFVRTWRHGDRFVPLGMGGHKKVQDFFSDRRVHRSLRTRLPLFFDRGGTLFAVSDMRIADPVKIDSGTRNVLKITVTPAVK